MTQTDRDRWNRRFERPDYVFGEEPNEFLARVAPALPRGRALAVADGEGRNSTWLARQGWQVHATDFSPVALAKARALADRHGVEVTHEEADSHDWTWPEGAYDLVVDIFTQFSPPDLRPRKWAGEIRALRPGGHLILVGYTPDQIAYATGGPKDPAHLYTEALLRDAFRELEILEIEETVRTLREGPGHSGPSAVIGIVARKG